MSAQDFARRIPRTMLELVFGFLAIHGAFNIGMQTGVQTTIRVYATIAALAILVFVIGTWILKKKDGPST